MCDCKDMARTFDDEHATVPPSNHHPRCEDYKLEQFVKVSVDGSSAIIETNEISNFDSPEYRKEIIMLTRDQFEALPEFQGF